MLASLHGKTFPAVAALGIASSGSNGQPGAMILGLTWLLPPAQSSLYKMSRIQCWEAALRNLAIGVLRCACQAVLLSLLADQSGADARSHVEQHGQAADAGLGRSRLGKHDRPQDARQSHDAGELNLTGRTR